MDTGIDFVFHKIQTTSSLSELLRSSRRILKPEVEFIGLSAILTAGFITETPTLSVFLSG
jgi:hypothetical protein